MSEVYAPSGQVSATSTSRFTAAEAATGTFGTMDRATITELLDRTRYLDQTGAIVNALAAYIGDSANSKNTLGLTINQGANDNELLSLKSSDVAHGFTGVTEADTFGAFEKASATAGGLEIDGITDSGTDSALILRGLLDGTAQTTKSSSALGVIRMTAAQRSGTGTTGVAANGNLLTIASDATTAFIFDTDGDAHADVSWTTF